jgi:hypothetical protein
MSTKASIRYQHNDGELPDWHLYTEIFDNEDVVYLEYNGVQADVTMIDSNWGPAAGTVLLRLPTATAKQLGLVPPTWKNEE